MIFYTETIRGRKLSLVNYYIHVPFCRRKCGYCAFYSVENAAPEYVNAYLDHLEKALRQSELPPGDTLYFGGGTPTLLDEVRLEKLLALARELLPLTPEAEISIEANPETLNPNKLEILRHGVNRISVGVQSFDPRIRETLGRNCSQAALESALEMVARAGFRHFNCDLIYGVPGQSVSGWAEDVRRAIDSGVDHVSVYALTPEEGSRLGGTFQTDAEAAADMDEAAESLLTAAGLARYEVSNYARPGGRCRHNQQVWRGGLLRGFGPAASSFDGADRSTECADLAAWLAGTPPEVDRISADRRREEIFAVNLRTVEGWTPKLWSQVGVADAWENRCRRGRESAARFPGCWQVEKARIALTVQGLKFWDSIAGDLLI